MSPSIIDMDTFNEVKDLMEEDMQSFIDTFLANSPKIIAQIKQAQKDGNIESVFLSAHQLKGGSGSIGALTLSDLAFKIEKAGRAGNAEPIPELLEQLKTEFELVETELKTLKV